VKFLIDAQMPRRLARELNSLGHDDIHTLDLPDRNATTDTTIRELADAQDRVVVTKDSDFRDSHLLQGSPRLLLRVATGNISNSDLLALFELNLDAIEAAFTDADFLELTPAELVVHRRRS